MSWDRWHSDPREGERGDDDQPYTPAHPLGRALTAEETAAALRDIWSQIQECRTPAQDEEIGEALAARFDREQ